MSSVDIALLVVSMLIVTGISALMPLAAYLDYKEAKKQNQHYQRTTNHE